ncbi:MAG: hypothetical protein U0Q18_37005 [Bryobacteraceae bacterium]
MLKRRRNVPGTVYLLHFSRKLHHAQHYIGWTEKLDARLDHHTDGNGARIVRAAAEQGISAECVRTWPGKTREFERHLKKMKKAQAYCPVCCEQRREEKRGMGRVAENQSHLSASLEGVGKPALGVLARAGGTARDDGFEAALRGQASGQNGARQLRVARGARRQPHAGRPAAAEVTCC